MGVRPFKWARKNEVFVPELDAEHRNLFRITEELRSAVEAEAPDERVRALFDALTADTEEHFRHEERLMRLAAYSAYQWHKGQHDTLRKRARVLAAQWQSGDREAPGMLVAFLSAWLQEHTAVADRMLGATLRN